jgi:hypothetical protein
MAGLVIVCDGTGLTKSKLAAASPEVQRQVMLEGFQALERMRVALEEYGRRMGWTETTTPAPIAAPRREARPRERRASSPKRARAPGGDEPPGEHPEVTVPPGWTPVQTVWYVARLLLDEPRTHWHLAALHERRGDFLAFDGERQAS